MGIKKEPVGSTEKIVGFCVLAILGGIVWWISGLQGDLNPAVRLLTDGPPEKGLNPQPAVDPVKPLVSTPVGIATIGPVETFTPVTLSDKINGKAELYLSSGFQRLDTQRFRRNDVSDVWAEVFVYDMGQPRNAFSVFTAQRRDDADSLDLTKDAYRTANAVFAAHGPYYLEIVSSLASEKSTEMLILLAEAFVRNTTVESEVIDEQTLFPEENLITDSLSLISANAFGFEKMDRVFTARYRYGDTEITAFLSRRETNEHAEQLAQSYGEFLVSFGGEALPPLDILPGGKRIEIMGTMEIVFTYGPFLAGIHEAEDRELAERTAVALKTRLDNVTDGD